MLTIFVFLAELSRAKRASGARWVRNFGKQESPKGDF